MIIRTFALLFILALNISAQEIVLKSVKEPFGGVEYASAELVQYTRDRIFTDGFDTIHVFDRKGKHINSFPLDSEEWVSDMAVSDIHGVVMVSTLRKHYDGKTVVGLIPCLRFLDLDGNYIGLGYDPGLRNPSQIYFRDLTSLPDGMLIANKLRKDSLGQAVELSEIRLHETDGSSYTNGRQPAVPGYEIEYVGQPLFVKAFQPGSPIERNKKILITYSPYDNAIYYSFAVKPEIRRIDRGLQKGNSESSPRLITLTGFRKQEEINKRKDIADVTSLIRGFRALPNGGFVIAHEPNPKEGRSSLDWFTESWDHLGRKNVTSEPVTGVFFGFVDDQIAFYHKEKGKHIIRISPLD